ncbi:MAG TPA: glycoside hydrolase domain-containing protein, partial [Anaerolineales bacterium]|nr:glycoside hydrolase domain-containing protein [Anaerolineales bacterium]
DGSGTVIYFDLEKYSETNANCRAAATSFVSGWTHQVQARGNLAGVYASPLNARDWWGIANEPDAVWLAHWVEDFYTPTASVYGSTYINDVYWNNHRRLRQYAGGHNETWGGQTINIDSDVLDGPFTVPNGTGNTTAPGTPSNPNPADGSAVARTNDTWLAWKTNGDTCSVRVWGDALDTTVSTSCSLYHLGVQGAGAYSWQVTATNGFGSTVGPIWHFDIQPAAPSGLTAVAASSTRVDLTWFPSADTVDSYLVYADGAQVADVSASATSYQVQNLACNSAHSFYVKAVQQGIQSEASNIASATTGSCAPVLVSPLKGTLIHSLLPTFTWQAVDDTAYYQIQISVNTSFTSNTVDTITSTTSYASTIRLAANKRYYWRVRAVDTLGQAGPWSATWNIRTAIRPPRLISPTNKITLPNRRPTFDWSDVTGASSYTLQVSSKANFSSIVRMVLVIGSSYSAPNSLPANMTLYWRVRANGVNGPSLWSAVWSFRTPATAVFEMWMDILDGFL